MKPPLKWAGGKRWLVPLLQDLWLSHSHRLLVEPFVGGLSVALGLNPKRALLNDANTHLINFYQQVKRGLQVQQAIKCSLQNTADYYYDKRTQFNSLIHSKSHRTPEAAGLFYFLIRTGYNGLCRFNLKGEFNVPFGQHKNIRYKPDFLDYRPVLKKWQFLNVDFERLKLEGDEFLYADPPYDVEFTQYHAKAFTWSDQLRLAKWLSQHSGPVVVSNQATPRILELYRNFGFKLFTLPAPRRIACTGDRRPALEMLAVNNFAVRSIKRLGLKEKS